MSGPRIKAVLTVGQMNASSFLTAYLGIPIFLGLYFDHKVFAGRQDSWYRCADAMDLKTGLEGIIAEESPGSPRSKGKWWMKINCFA